MTTEHTAFVCQSARQFGWDALYEYWESESMADDEPFLGRNVERSERPILKAGMTEIQATHRTLPDARQPSQAIMQVLEIELRRQAR